MKTKNNLRKFMELVALVVLVLSSSIAVVQVLGADTDSAAGTVTIGNADPTGESVKYVDNAYSVVTNYDPDDSTIWGINTTIGDPNSLADLYNVTWFLFEDSVHGAGAADDWDSATPTGNDLISITWNESSDSWTLNQGGSFTQWNLETPVDPGAASGLSSFEFTARFAISKATFADTDWNVSVITYDDQGATNTTWATGFVEMNTFYELVISSSTFAYGSVTTSSTNNTMSANITVDFSANFNNWELVVNVSDWTSGVEPDVDNEVQNTLVLSDVAIENTGNSLWVQNTQNVGPGDWDDQVRMTSETPIQRLIHLWFSDPGGQFTANEEYDVTFWIVIRDNT